MLYQLSYSRRVRAKIIHDLVRSGYSVLIPGIGVNLYLTEA